MTRLSIARVQIQGAGEKQTALTNNSQGLKSIVQSIDLLPSGL